MEANEGMEEVEVTGNDDLLNRLATASMVCARLGADPMKSIVDDAAAEIRRLRGEGMMHITAVSRPEERRCEFRFPASILTADTDGVFRQVMRAGFEEFASEVIGHWLDIWFSDECPECHGRLMDGACLNEACRVFMRKAGD